MLTNLRAGIEYLCGERDVAPPVMTGGWVWVARCFLWAAAIVLIYAFCGQSSKFIYIDF